MKKCEQCGISFKKKPKDTYKFFSIQKFCCHKCYSISLKNKPKQKRHKIGQHRPRIKNNFYVNNNTVTVVKKQGNKKYIILLSIKNLQIIKDYTITVSRYVRVYKNKKTISLASLILGKKEGYYIDHINRNKLDNRIENLRFVTPQQNMFNKLCKGYSFDKSHNKYIAHIRLNGKTKHLGRFEKLDDARRAYQSAHVKFFGEFSPFKDLGYYLD